MSNITRREFIRIAGGISVGMAAGACSHPFVEEKYSGKSSLHLKELMKTKIDYTKARAVPSICFGCTTHCGVIGWVQDGIVRKIEGNPLDPNSKGKVCAKAQGMIAYTYYPERIIYPMRRMGKRGEGKWKRISWDEALDEIAKKMKTIREEEHPERFVFHYGRDKTKGFTKRFTNAFGTPNRLNRRSICSSNRRAPLMSFYGRDFEWETQDFENTKFILNFGANPMEAYQGGFFMMQRIQQARVDQGAKMITFEVRPSATASVSDKYFPVFPGTDGAIALAMVNVIIDNNLYDKKFWDRWVNYPLNDLKKQIAGFTPDFAEKESGVPAEKIIDIAIEFAKASPKCCTMSNRGSAKHYNGVQADRAIRLLDVLVGNVGRPGGFCLSTLRMWENRYGQNGLPNIVQPEPRPSKVKPFLPGTTRFNELPAEVKERVRNFPPEWQNKYYGELATPSEYPLSWHWYPMRVGQLVYPYIKEGRAKVEMYMSYTLGASYGYPEAKVAREVLLDEKLIPFHVAIDIGYSEQASFADIILPEATSLERWDAHSTNCYGLVPYTGIRQPMVKPLGEAKPVQIILRDLASKIGGSMETFFNFNDVEEFYQEWYKQLPISWEEFKKRGIWYDPDRPKDYELYERPVSNDDLKGSFVNKEDNIIYKIIKGKKLAVGIMQGGKPVCGFPTPSRKIQVYDEVFPLAAKHVGLPISDGNASPLCTYFKIPSHVNLQRDEFILTTFKWNVHTQGRTGHLKYQAEIVHTNPVFINPETAKRFDLKNRDLIELTVYRPKGHTYRAGEKEPVGKFRNIVRLLNGMHPKVVAVSHHVGHWEHGSVGRSNVKLRHESKAGTDPHLEIFNDKDIPKRIWWSKSQGGPGGGVHINDFLPIDPAPLVGGQNWFDNVCIIKKV